MSTVRVDSVVYLITTFSFPPSARVNSVSCEFNLVPFNVSSFFLYFFLSFQNFKREGGRGIRNFSKLIRYQLDFESSNVTLARQILFTRLRGAFPPSFSPINTSLFHYSIRKNAIELMSADRNRISAAIICSIMHPPLSFSYPIK